MKKWIFKPVDRNTPDLFPASIQDYRLDDHMARFVVDVVEQMDLSDLITSYRGGGSKAWHPAMMLPLLFYGYAMGVFSSRKLENMHDIVIGLLINRVEFGVDIYAKTHI